MWHGVYVHVRVSLCVRACVVSLSLPAPNPPTSACPLFPLCPRCPPPSWCRNAQLDLDDLVYDAGQLCGCQVGPAGAVSGYLAHGTSMDYLYHRLQTAYPITLEIYGPEGRLGGGCAGCAGCRVWGVGCGVWQVVGAGKGGGPQDPPCHVGAECEGREGGGGSSSRGGHWLRPLL